MAFIIFIYLFVACSSALFYIGRWLFNNVFIVFIPFMAVYYLICGDVQKKQEAKMILKSIFQIGLLYFFILGIYFIIQNFKIIITFIISSSIHFMFS